MTLSAADAIARMRALTGPGGVLEAPGDLEPYLREWRGLARGQTLAVVRPRSTEEMAEIVRTATAARLPITPQGGNTGLCGGALGQAGGIILSLQRMTAIRAIDRAGRVLTIEAGATLAAAQAAADAAGLLFPLSLASEGSAQIGGALSTNAGGVHVLRYGTARELVLGVEAVLPDGRILHGLKGLRKDNTGYDLKQLLLGAEGTLGVVTAAALRLFARPRVRVVGLAAVASPAAALALMDRLREATGDLVSAFEYLARRPLAFVLAHVPGARDPFAAVHAHYALFEAATSRDDPGLADLVEATLAAAIDAGEAVDAVIARSEAQAAALWRLREEASEAQKPEGGSIKHDVSTPIARVPEFLARAPALVEAIVPACRPVAFGHLGDGNIHFNVSQPEGADRAAFLARWPEVSRAVHDLVAELGGSFSAEHGVGRLKLPEMRRYKSPLELELMARIKAALDPHGLMNPGAVVAPHSGDPSA